MRDKLSAHPGVSCQTATAFKNKPNITRLPVRKEIRAEYKRSGNGTCLVVESARVALSREERDARLPRTLSATACAKRRSPRTPL